MRSLRLVATALPHRRVFVTVGTDCHPFERLVTWMGKWAAQAGTRA